MATFLIITASVLVAFLLINYFIGLTIYLLCFKRRPDHKIKYPKEWDTYAPIVEAGQKWYFSLPIDTLTLRVDNLNLKGYYYNAKSNKTAILIHGYRSSLASRVTDAPFYYKEGYNVLLVNLRAHGTSEGVKIGMASDYADILKWIELLEANYQGVESIVLSGCSMGGAIVCSLSGDERLPKKVKCIISDCAYTSCDEQFRSMISGVPKFILNYLLWVNKVYLKLFKGMEFDKLPPIESVKRAKVPMLFYHGTSDDFVPYYMLEKLYQNCNAPVKEKVEVEGVKHGLVFYDRKELCESKLKEFLDANLK